MSSNFLKFFFRIKLYDLYWNIQKNKKENKNIRSININGKLIIYCYFKKIKIDKTFENTNRSFAGFN